MKKLFSNPITRRVLGAVAAGGMTLLTTGDLKAAGVTTASFIIYGGTHKGTEKAASK